MNDLDTELEIAIRRALATDAARAPQPVPAWNGLAQYTGNARPRRRSPRITVAAIGLAAAAIGGAIALRPVKSPKVVRTAGFVPAGIEFPLTDLGPATQSMSITTNGLSRKVSVPGLDSLTVARSLIYGNGPTAELAECMFPGTFGTPDSFGMCISEAIGGRAPEVLHDAGFWISNGVPQPPFDYSVWTNVPAGTAFVSFAGQAQQFWQRPVSGLAVFPTLGLATAYGADGSELGRIDLSKAAASDPIARAGPFYDISDAQIEELRLLTISATAACLTAHGGAIAEGSNVAVFDPSVNQVEVWDGCVVETKRIVAERVTAMNPPQVKTS
jgi:hypothetical protein